MDGRDSVLFFLQSLERSKPIVQVHNTCQLGGDVKLTPQNASLFCVLVSLFLIAIVWIFVFRPMLVTKYFTPLKVIKLLNLCCLL